VESERLLLAHVEDVAGMVVKLLLASRLEFGIYNALCESVVVGDLKRTVEGLNSRISIRLGESYAAGNPRMLDCSRLQREFGFRTLPIFEQLRRAAER
jgi:nucleoside-diphosphate-sugar epimerase